MRKLLPILMFMVLVAVVAACGRLNEKFGRAETGFTQVTLQRNGGPEPFGLLNGGLMVWFVEANNPTNGYGRSFGFPTEDLANGAVVTMPNGAYKVYAVGWQGGSPLSGQARCGVGNSGGILELRGSPSSVGITLNMGNCNFGGSGPFGHPNAADSGVTNFDFWTINLCTGNPYSACTPSTPTNGGFRLRVLGGEKFGAGTFAKVGMDTLSSNCHSFSSGTISLSANPVVGYIGLSVPLEIAVYSDSSCSTAPVERSFPGGLASYINSGSSATNAPYVDMTAASSSTTYINIFKDF